MSGLHNFKMISLIWRINVKVNRRDPKKCNTQQFVSYMVTTRYTVYLMEEVNRDSHNEVACENVYI